MTLLRLSSGRTGRLAAAPGWSRRRLLQAGLLASCPMPAAWAAAPEPVAALRPLDAAQCQAFRQWFVALVEDQVLRPSPRWVHRDCAGLVRFAAAEALRPHTAAWVQAMGWSSGKPRPPELALGEDQRGWAGAWALPEGRRAAYAPAIAIVQNNTRYVGKSRTDALPGDLLFFDQGDDQHLMVWTGRRVAYHNGAEPRPGDNGLRQLPWEQLMRLSDTRWRPHAHNPNFAGLFRFGFLSR
ncbi:DUF1175 family protein [Eleftheria terrae]|uniref:DUF1175 family protein n=1 Tax=Eleftheria terrae TaxID=1597781 RepID=UPI00263AC2E2|nr:DUF1175 family protein [Eleftheria terrae]WKB53936.1 DUF1175 family protein [Eleftheria terrae]